MIFIILRMIHNLSLTFLLINFTYSKLEHSSLLTTRASRSFFFIHRYCPLSLCFLPWSTTCVGTDENEKCDSKVKVVNIPRDDRSARFSSCTILFPYPWTRSVFIFVRCSRTTRLRIRARPKMHIGPFGHWLSALQHAWLPLSGSKY